MESNASSSGAADSMASETVLRSRRLVKSTWLATMRMSAAAPIERISSIIVNPERFRRAVGRSAIIEWCSD